MITTKQMSTFNAAAEKFVQFFERGDGATEEGKVAFMTMMHAAPERIRKMLQIGLSRGMQLLPFEITRPPVGKSYWDWVYSPADIQKRAQECKAQSNLDEMAAFLKDSCKASGVSFRLYPVPTSVGQAVVASEHEPRLNEIVADFEARLALATDVDEAVYLQTLLAGYLRHLGQAVPELSKAAPLAPVHCVNMDAVHARVAKRLERKDAEVNREIDMMQARLAVDTAIAQFGQDSQQARIAMAKAITFLPDDIKANLDAKAREMGLMPPASGYTADGQPVFTVEALASHFGMDPEEVMQDVGEFGMTVDASTIHLPQ
jgi:hypothetical protein